MTENKDLETVVILLVLLLVISFISCIIYKSIKTSFVYLEERSELLIIFIIEYTR